MAFAKRTIKWNLISTILICQMFIGRLVRLRFKSSILLTIRNHNLQRFSHTANSMTVGSVYNHGSFTRLTIVPILKFIWCKGQYLKYFWIICCYSQNCLLKQIFTTFIPTPRIDADALKKHCLLPETLLTNDWSGVGSEFCRIWTSWASAVKVPAFGQPFSPEENEFEIVLLDYYFFGQWMKSSNGWEKYSWVLSWKVF